MAVGGWHARWLARGQRRWAAIVEALVTDPAWTNLLVLLGMVWAIVSVGTGPAFAVKTIRRSG
jgi:hypothetical protein